MARLKEDDHLGILANAEAKGTKFKTKRPIKTIQGTRVCCLPLLTSIDNVIRGCFSENFGV